MKILLKLSLLMIAALLVFSNCKKDDNGNDSPGATNLRVCSALNSNNICSNHQSTIDINSPEIFASMRIENSTATTTIDIDWYYSTTETFIANANTSPTLLGVSESDFDMQGSLSEPITGWLTGDYRIEVTIDNISTVTQTFKIE